MEKDNKPCLLEPHTTIDFVPDSENTKTPSNEVRQIIVDCLINAYAIVFIESIFENY
jgi:hypothetical protein